MAAYLLASMVATVAILVFACCTVVWMCYRRGRRAAAMPLNEAEKPRGPERPRSAPLEQRPAPIAGKPSELTRVSGLTMREAEDWLDWLEQHGYTERGLVCEEDKFAVEYRVDVGHQPGPPHTSRTETTGELKAIF